MIGGKSMKPETIELILKMFQKETKLWSIETKHGFIDGAKETLDRVEKAEADFRKAVGA
jgi:hypothetical protein